jgi:hypothetical protein
MTTHDLWRLQVLVALITACSTGAPAPSHTAPARSWTYPPECEMLEHCPGWHVSANGTVTDSDGDPLAGITVDASGQGSYDLPGPVTGPDGRYDLSDHNMEPGRWEIMAYSRAGGRSVTVTVTIEPGETKTVDLVLPRN